MIVVGMNRFFPVFLPAVSTVYPTGTYRYYAYTSTTIKNFY